MLSTSSVSPAPEASTTSLDYSVENHLESIGDGNADDRRLWAAGLGHRCLDRQSILPKKIEKPLGVHRIARCLSLDCFALYGTADPRRKLRDDEVVQLTELYRVDDCVEDDHPLDA